MASAEFKQLLNGLVDAALIADDSGSITLANTAASTLFGCSIGDLTGTALDGLLPRQQDHVHDTIFLGDSSDPLCAAPVRGVRHPVSARHHSGAAFDVRVATSSLDESTFLVVVTPLVVAANATGTYLEVLRQLTDSAVDATVVIDERGIIRGYNPAAETTFGFPREMALGKNVSMLMPEQYAVEHDNNLAKFRQEASEDAHRAVGMRRPVVARTSTGVMVPIRIALSHIKLAGGRFFVGSATQVNNEEGTTMEMVNDIIERRTRQLRDQRDEFERLSSTDQLTQLANRREFDRTLEREVRRGRRANVATSLIMLDIDHFKLYNDHYGHQAGDDCLQRTARIIDKVFRRGTDLTARYGGEEFAVVMGATNYPTAMVLAQRVVDAVNRAAVAHAKSPSAPHVTISVGVTAAAPDDDSGPEQLIEWADAALYEAKHSGRNRAHGADHGGETSLDGISLGPTADERGAAG